MRRFLHCVLFCRIVNCRHSNILFIDKIKNVHIKAQNPPYKLIKTFLLITVIIISYLLIEVLVQGLQPSWQEYKCLCTSEYDPVCGSDRMRYRNVCTFECKQGYLKFYKLPTLGRMDCTVLPPATLH